MAKSDNPATSYRFNVGTLACMAVSDGTNDYQVESVVKGVPRAEVEAALRRRRLPTDTLKVSYSALLIESGSRRILVDTGAGAMGGQPDASYGHLLAHLREQGIAQESIDAIIVTHAHPDHIGGILDGQGQAIYPNARYIMTRAEWRFWMDDDPDLAGVAIPEAMRSGFTQFAREHLLPVQSRVDLLEDGAEVAPGVSLVATPGHTAGHVSVALSSNGERFLEVGDAILLPIHLDYLTWTAPVDLLPEQTIATRQKLVERAVASGELVRVSHFPFPGLGYIKHSKRLRSVFPWRRRGGTSGNRVEVAARSGRPGAVSGHPSLARTHRHATQ
jgi:glyoxylase-like metal-dependent hydrolase (beta-lactamase superfamily II)